MAVGLGRGYLPERFNFDGNAIGQFAKEGVGPHIDDSFRAISSVYSALGLATHDEAAGLFTFGVAALNLLLVVHHTRSTPPTVSILALFGLTTALSVVYLGTYSKDFLTSVLVLIVLATAGRRLAGEVSVLTAIFLYAAYFRSYWFLVLCGYLAFRLLLARSPDRPTTRRIGFLMGALVLCVALGSLLVIVSQGVSANYYREVVNADRDLSQNANTLIAPFLSIDGPVGGVLNNVITAVTLMVPIPLATIGGAYYLVLALTIFIVWFLFWRALTTLAPLGPRQTPLLVQRAAALSLSFVAAQSVFEPDYGSSLRHLTPLLPLMLYVMWWARGVAMSRGGRQVPSPGAPSRCSEWSTESSGVASTHIPTTRA